MSRDDVTGVSSTVGKFEQSTIISDIKDFDDGILNISNWLEEMDKDSQSNSQYVVAYREGQHESFNIFTHHLRMMMAWIMGHLYRGCSEGQVKPTDVPFVSVRKANQFPSIRQAVIDGNTLKSVLSIL